MSLSIKQKILRDGKEGCARKPKKGKRAMRRQWRRKRARFEEGSWLRAQSARKLAGPTVYSCTMRGEKLFRHAEITFRR